MENKQELEKTNCSSANTSCDAENIIKSSDSNSTTNLPSLSFTIKRILNLNII